MRKIIAAFNMTLDGVCDHTALNADDEIHQHYTDLILSADIIIYGRITYQLMENHWPTVVKEPTGNKAFDDFAIALDHISKVVFSRTLKDVEWKNSVLAKGDLKEEVMQLRQQAGGDILVGSRSMIIALLNLHLIDEFQLCVQPIIAGKGMMLFEDIDKRIGLKLIKMKTFRESGTMAIYYKPERN